MEGNLHGHELLGSQRQHRHCASAAQVVSSPENVVSGRLLREMIGIGGTLQQQRTRGRDPIRAHESLSAGLARHS